MADYKFIGCYTDKPTKRSLPNLADKGTEQTLDQCIAYANSSQSDYLGMQYWELNNDMSTAQCYLSSTNTFINYGQSSDCIQNDQGEWLGDEDVNAIYQRVINVGSNYKPIILNDWLNSITEVSTRDAWQFGLKLVSDGSKVYFGSSDVISTWTLNQLDGNYTLSSSDGRSVVSVLGKLLLQNISDTSQKPLQFSYNQTMGNLINANNYLGSGTTIPLGVAPPSRAAILQPVSGSPIPPNFTWIATNYPNGNPPNNKGPVITPASKIWSYVFLILGVILVIFVITMLVHFLSGRYKD
jgi:hypothetical protein